MGTNRVRELYENYVGALEEWQIKLAIARLLHFGVPEDAWEDVMQELAIVILRFRFDPIKAHAASERTILCRRLDNRIRMLARSNARRVAFHERLSVLRHPTEDADSIEDAITDVEVRELLQELTPEEKDICKGLMNGESINWIARRTGQTWGTIDRRVRRIREIFRDRGFDAWPV
ncbi:MAG: sigma-70 family RNA polymerase sigma factor [Phycisphaerae bacterium]|nr:sigma-70 family RNA polymerase sigma factor [Phycisphaerae bacterium]